MGISVRVFIFDNDDIKLIPYARYNRLFHGDKNESITEYANQRIRIAVVFIESKNCKPINVLNID